METRTKRKSGWAPPEGKTANKILETAGNKTVDKDKRVSRKQVLARLVWEVATTGKAIMPDGTTLQVDPKTGLT